MVFPPSILKMSSPNKRNGNRPVLTPGERNVIRRSLASARADGNDIRQHIIKTEAILRSLCYQKERNKMNISQLEKTLVIHRILPREVIGQIFSILCTEKISIPHIRERIPPQITVSHVCSKWREIALETPALWSSVEILQPYNNDWVKIAMELLFSRASVQGVNLTLDMQEVNSEDWRSVFFNAVLPLHVKNLHLRFPFSTPESLVSRVPADLIANVNEIALEIIPDSKPPVVQSDSDHDPRFFNKVTSLMVSEWIDLDLYDLPWTQMRVLCFNIRMPSTTVTNILCQCPLLEVCGVSIGDNNVESMDPKTLNLPHLRIFHIFLHSNKTDANKVLRSFRCPNLRDFGLQASYSYWTSETYNIIQSHYNLSQLERFDTRVFPYPLRKLLLDAPMLQQLIVRKVVIDDKVIRRISFGKLGRHLRLIAFGGKYDAVRVLDMVTSRQKHVNEVVEASRSWRDPHISSIRQVILWNQTVPVGKLQGKGEALKEMGITVSYSDKPLISHPLYAFFNY